MSAAEFTVTSKDFYISKRTPGLEDGAATYDTPKPVCGIAEVAVAYTKNPVKIYESGRTIYNKTRIADATVTLSTHTMSLEQRMELYYSLKSEQATEGYIEGADTDTPQEVAIGWSVLLDGGKYFCTWFYLATAAPSDESYKTSDDQGPKIEPMSIAFNCSRTEDGKLRRTKICADAEEMKKFFTSVEPVQA